MRQIQVNHTSNYLTIDDEDYDRVNQWSWILNNKGTALIACVNGKITTLGRFLLNYDGPDEVDHKDIDLFNNQKSNLRVLTSSQNKGNRDKQSNNTSGYKGVCWDKSRRKWQVNLAKKLIGRFDNIEDAARAYNEAASKYFGNAAKLNLILPTT